jgi:hypothetical protein
MTERSTNQKPAARRSDSSQRLQGEIRALRDEVAMLRLMVGMSMELFLTLGAGVSEADADKLVQIFFEEDVGG